MTAPRHHHRQRFRGPSLAQTQSGDRALIGSVAQQVIAADTAHGDDPPIAQHCKGGGQ